ncbi:hypothetical protein ACHAWF_011553 [Thalassiosira exigua]
MVSFISKATCITAALSSVAAQIAKWDIIYDYLETTIQPYAQSEIALHYQISKGRDFKVDIFDKDCADAISGMSMAASPERTTFSTDYDKLEIVLGFDKSEISSSNIWSPDNELEFCVQVQLLSTLSDVIREDKRNIDIAFDFAVDLVDFNGESTDMNPAPVTSASFASGEDSHISACKCTDLKSFVCTANTVNSSDTSLHICIESTNAGVEIAFIDRLELLQTHVGGNVQRLLVIDGLMIQDREASYIEFAKNGTAVSISSALPSNFFSYQGVFTVIASGSKLASSRRHVVADDRDVNPASKGVASARELNKEDILNMSPFEITVNFHQVSSAILLKRRDSYLFGGILLLIQTFW